MELELWQIYPKQSYIIHSIWVDLMEWVEWGGERLSQINYLEWEINELGGWPGAASCSITHLQLTRITNVSGMCGRGGMNGMNGMRNITHLGCNKSLKA